MLHDNEDVDEADSILEVVSMVSLPVDEAV
jgi:hypothetical protein